MVTGLSPRRDMNHWQLCLIVKYQARAVGWSETCSGAMPTIPIKGYIGWSFCYLYFNLCCNTSIHLPVWNAWPWQAGHLSLAFTMMASASSSYPISTSWLLLVGFNQSLNLTKSNWTICIPFSVVYLLTKQPLAAAADHDITAVHQLPCISCQEKGGGLGQTEFVIWQGQLSWRSAF